MGSSEGGEEIEQKKKIKIKGGKPHGDKQQYGDCQGKGGGWKRV